MTSVYKQCLEQAPGREAGSVCGIKFYERDGLIYDWVITNGPEYVAVRDGVFVHCRLLAEPNGHRLECHIEREEAA